MTASIRFARTFFAISPVLITIAAFGPVVAAEPEQLRGALLSAEMAQDERLGDLARQGTTAVVLPLSGNSADERREVARAAERVRAAGLQLYYWIEVARCVELAEQHPRWMASLQGHAEWRRFHRDFPRPAENEVVKNYPWVPVTYRESYDGQRARMRALLADRPAAVGVFLNDLQGAPSACGCGNPVCRWTADYGPIKTATPLGDDAAARFVADVEALVPQSRVVPVWTPECEEHDVAADGLCAGVGCFQGICWKAYTKQLKPVAAHSPQLGVLLLYKEFGQDVAFHREPAGWVRQAIRGFAVIPPRHGGAAIEARRLVAVLQGWNVDAHEIDAQVKQAGLAGCLAIIVAYLPIDQSWRPKIISTKSEADGTK